MSSSASSSSSSRGSLTSSSSSDFLAYDGIAFDVSPSSSTCSLSSSSTFTLPPAPAPRPRRAALPAYDSPPPPAYTSKPSRTITVTQSAFESLSSRGGAISLEDALGLAVDREIDARQRRREAEIRLRLEPLLFPAPRSLGQVVGGMFGRGKGKAKREVLNVAELQDDEREVAQKMVQEYLDRVHAMGY